ncbi:MAG TPA: chemotaxis protein CheW [Fluviicoccus sp.]|nr:chemotaxis protein CheW [Fluviicoccus sp.]
MAAIEAPGANRPAQVLLLRVQDRWLAMDLRHVERIFLLMDLQPVPQGPACLAGLMDYHGQSLAVFDLGLWLGLPEPVSYDAATPIILCDTPAGRAAFVVREVAGVEAVPPAAVMPLDVGGAPFQGTLGFSTGMALLLDMDRVLASIRSGWVDDSGRKQINGYRMS